MKKRKPYNRITGRYLKEIKTEDVFNSLTEEWTETTEIAKKFSYAKQTISPVLQELRADGLVELMDCGIVYLWRLSPKGKATQEEQKKKKNKNRKKSD